MKSSPFFILFSTHRFNGRAYGGVGRTIVGPFPSREDAGEFSKRMQDSIQAVDVRISQNMPQLQVYDEILAPLAATTKPEDALNVLTTGFEDQVEAPTGVAAGDLHMLLVVVTSWNGRRFAGDTIILVGPFTTADEMTKWGKELTALPYHGHSAFRKTVRIEIPEILGPTNLEPADVAPELFA